MQGVTRAMVVQRKQVSPGTFVGVLLLATLVRFIICADVTQDAHELLSQVIDQIKEDTIRENKSFKKRKAIERKSPGSEAKTDLENIEVNHAKARSRI